MLSLNFPAQHCLTDLNRLGGNVDIMAGPAHLAELVAGLEARGIEHSVMIEDVERLSERTKMPTYTGKGPRDMDWDSYHPVEDMYGYFDYLGWSSNQPQHTESPDTSHDRKASALPWARKPEITCFLAQGSAEAVPK